MEVDVSMIIGYVMKFNYALPYNVSYLTEPYVRYDRSISRRSEPDGDDVPAASATGTTFVLIRAKRIQFGLAIIVPVWEISSICSKEGRNVRANSEPIRQIKIESCHTSRDVARN